MSSEELKKVIGQPVRDVIVCDRYGDATLYESGHVMADPCYLDGGEIQEAIRTKYPYVNGSRSLELRKAWTEFDLNGQRSFFRDTGGDGNFWGHNVDSGCLVVVPLGCLSAEKQALFNLQPA